MTKHQDENVDPGAYIGQQPEFAAETIKDGPQRADERVAGEATQSTGVAHRGANPDPGWSDPPEGHRHGPRVSDDDLRSAGDRGS